MTLTDGCWHGTRRVVSTAMLMAFGDIHAEPA